MSKKVKFSFDLVISDEKKEMATNETTNPQMLVERPDNITALASLARARRKRKFILGLVIIGILLVGLGGYGHRRCGLAKDGIDRFQHRAAME